MKKRKIIYILLIFIIILSMFDTSLSEVNAKSKTVNIILKYKNKKITVAKYKQNKKGYNKLKSSAQGRDFYNKLHIGTFYEDGYYNSEEPGNAMTVYADYEYKTTKDLIRIALRPCYERYINKEEPRPKDATYTSICIKSKKFSLNGIKVGMSKKKAVKQLKKYFKNVDVNYSNNYAQVISGNFDFGCIQLEFKKNKVYSIYYCTDKRVSDIVGHPELPPEMLF